jgi:hypothetical protein
MLFASRDAEAVKRVFARSPIPVCVVLLIGLAMTAVAFGIETRATNTSVAEQQTRDTTQDSRLDSLEADE